jgi:hypothetical protein
VPRQEEVVLAFPAKWVPLRRVRSGLLVSSLKAIRERGLFDRYKAFVPPSRLDEILGLTAATWINPELAFVHYEAADRLGLDYETQVEIGMQVAKHLQQGFLSVVLRFVIETGVNPWHVLVLNQKLWDRYFDGSAAAVYKLGPKEARAEFVGFPLARVPYVRNGVGGILRGIAELVCKRVYVQQVADKCSATTLAYRLSWA